MDSLLELFHRLRDVKAIVAWGGYVGLTAIIFAETGLFVGFFLPGDSLLVTAGLLSSQPQFGLNAYLLGAILTVASIVGNATGYWIGRFSGPRLFTREESLFFKPKYLRQAHEFYEKHGGKTVIIARFMPIVRTFVPFVAGVAEMSYPAFATFNVTGAVAWVGICIGAGYAFGNVPVVKENFSLVVIGIVVVSILPMVFEYLRHRRGRTVRT